MAERNRLHVIGKQPNQSWSSWFSKRPEGFVVRLGWQWGNDPARKVMNGWAKQGYFKKESSAGMDSYTRTSQPHRAKKTV